MFNIIARTTCLAMLLPFFPAGFAAAIDKRSTHWDYIHEDEWPLQCKEGTKQSPIALSPGISEETEFSSLIFENYDITYPAQSKNNGHSLEVRLHVENQPSLKGGGLPHVYLLDHLHFHWQSEHVVEGSRFPMELHLVHYASRFPNLTEALKHTGGVAVFAVLFYISPDNAQDFQPLVDVIEKVQDHVNTIQEMRITVDHFLPRDTAGYYRYNGSLTTPDCTEGLLWTVFTHYLPISRDQVASFPLLQTEEHEQVRTNYRSLQKLNGRRIQIRSSPVSDRTIRSSGAISFDLTCKTLFSLLLFIKIIRLA